MSTASPSTDINLSSTAQVVTTTTEATEEEDSSFNNYHSGLIALSILILLCNLFAIQIYKRHDKIRRNYSNVLLFSLAISDLVVGVLYLPLLISCEKDLTPTDAFSKACRVNYILGNFCGFSTIFHILALTVEKYMAVLHPFQRLNVSTHGTYKKILFSIWFLALFFAVIPLFWIFDKDAGLDSWLKKFYNYAILKIVVFFGLSVVILMYCYCRMFLQIHVKLSERTQTGRVQARVRNDRKTILVFLLFFAIFIIGWFPWFFFALSHQNADLVSPEVKDFLVALRFAGAFLNPLLYAFLKNDYKQAVQADLTAFCSSCPKRLRFQKLAGHQCSSNQMNNNNCAERGTLTTGTTGVRLQKIESTQHRPFAGSFTSAGSATGVQSSSHAEDTDL